MNVESNFGLVPCPHYGECASYSVSSRRTSFSLGHVPYRGVRLRMLITVALKAAAKAGCSALAATLTLSPLR